MKGNSEGLLYLYGGKETDQHKFRTSNNYLNNYVDFLSYNGKFVNYKPNKKVYANGEISTSTSKFKIIKDRDHMHYNIINTENEYIIVQENGIIYMKKDQPLLESEKVNAKGEITQVAKYGPELGDSKKFKIKINYSI